jgi:hypothetical protein
VPVVQVREQPADLLYPHIQLCEAQQVKILVLLAQELVLYWPKEVVVEVFIKMVIQLLFKQ